MFAPPVVVRLVEVPVAFDVVNTKPAVASKVPFTHTAASLRLLSVRAFTLPGA